MKEIILNGGFKALVDDEDFDLVNRYKWRACKHGRGYRVSRSNSKTFNGEWFSNTAMLHRFILKAKKGEIIDHIDGNALNNQRSNLRICTHQQNCFNKPSHLNSSSRFRGVFWHKKWKKWYAKININKKKQHIGTYHCEIEAALAYNVAASFAFREFARFNIV